MAAYDTVIIPETDSPRVAAIAAALYLTEITFSPDDTFEKKLKRFVDAYDIIFQLADRGDVAEARARLEKLSE